MAWSSYGLSLVKEAELKSVNLIHQSEPDLMAITVDLWSTLTWKFDKAIHAEKLQQEPAR